MHASHPQLRSRTAAWALGFVLLTVAAQVWPGVAAAWQFDRGTYGAGAVWQLLTAQWVHWGLLHALANATGFVVLLWAFQRLVAGRLQALALLGGYAGVAVVVALDATCMRYAGASGALHGLLAGGALVLCLPVPGRAQAVHRRMRALGGVVLLGLAAKLVVQHAGATPQVPGWLGFVTYYPAHEAGALGGLLAVLVGYAWSLRHRPVGPSGAGQQ